MHISCKQLIKQNKNKYCIGINKLFSTQTLNNNINSNNAVDVKSNAKSHAKPKSKPTNSESTASTSKQLLDHRTIGANQQLWDFHILSPGSPFFLPHGTILYNNLVNYLRSEYITRGYNEIRTPLIYDWRLWLKSGHWQNYRENMFLVQGGQQGEQEKEIDINANNNENKENSNITQMQLTELQKNNKNSEHASCAHHAHIEDITNNNSTNTDTTDINAPNLSSGFIGHQPGRALYGLKPMNCPGHCLLFASRKRSYRELPIRFADFSDLHRNESSGSLSGLTRVRRFAQDDAHIFCTLEQVNSEILNCLQFIDSTYKLFGFEFKLKLSTRPDNYIGDINIWNKAENELKTLLDHIGYKWELNVGDGAFYGPKIDITILDSNNRQHQCATIQLDFQLPIRFNLQYQNSNNNMDTPVLIHRAILGSIERMLAILSEHYQGKWPLWLSPRQIKIITITDKQLHIDAAKLLLNKLQNELYPYTTYIDIDSEVLSVSKKVRSGQLLGYNYLIVIGDEESKNLDKLTIRIRDQNYTKPILLTDFIQSIRKELKDKSLKSLLL